MCAVIVAYADLVTVSRSRRRPNARRSAVAWCFSGSASRRGKAGLREANAFASQPLESRINVNERDHVENTESDHP